MFKTPYACTIFLLTTRFFFMKIYIYIYLSLIINTFYLKNIFILILFSTFLCFIYFTLQYYNYYCNQFSLNTSISHFFKKWKNDLQSISSQSLYIQFFHKVKKLTGCLSFLKHIRWYVIPFLFYLFSSLNWFFSINWVKINLYNKISKNKD